MTIGPIEEHPQTEETSRTGQRPSVTEIVHGMGVLLGLLVVFGTWAVLTGRVFRHREGPARLLRPLAILGAAIPWAYAFAIRPWHLRWGATDEEVEQPLPSDELVPDPGIQSTRAITVNAPVEMVWQWLAQVGQDRGGFYSYEWLENLAGAQMRNADRIHPECQHREVGETVFVHPAIGPKVAAFEPGRAMVLEGWGAFVVEPVDEHATRVILRSRVPRRFGGLIYYLLTIEIPHFIMERRMLKGIKERAE